MLKLVIFLLQNIVWHAEYFIMLRINCIGKKRKKTPCLFSNSVWKMSMIVVKVIECNMLWIAPTPIRIIIPDPVASFHFVAFTTLVKWLSLSSLCFWGYISRQSSVIYIFKLRTWKHYFLCFATFLGYSFTKQLAGWQN